MNFKGINSLRTRILLNFLLMLSIVVIVTLYTVQRATYTHSTGQLASYAQTSSVVVQDKIQNSATVLGETANAIRRNFSFISAVADSNEDTASLLVALENFQSRANADIAWVQDKNGETIISNPIKPAEDLNIDARDFVDGAINWLKLDDTFYLVRSTPHQICRETKED